MLRASGPTPGALLLGSTCLALYAAVRAVHWGSMPGSVAFPDTAVYERIAAIPIGQLEFWAAGRPWTLPLLYKLLHSDVRWIGACQLGLSIAAWSWLAVAVGRSLRSRWLRPAGAALILLFSASSNVVLWDRALLSESVSISLMAAWLAAWLQIASGWRPWRVAGLLAIAALWCFARDSNAYVLLLLGALLALLAGARRRHRRGFAVAALLLCLAAASGAAAGRSGRWVKPFLNVLTQRILPDAGRVAWFAERGMPVPPRLASLAGKWASGEEHALFRDPELGEFRGWLYAHARRSYTLFLLAHPVSSALQPWRDRQQLLFREPAKTLPGFEPLLPGAVAALLYARPRPLLALAAAAAGLCAAAGAGVARGRLAWRPVWAVALIALGLAWPHAALTWHGDAAEISRHAVQASIQLRLGLWLVLLCAADAVLALRTASPAGS